MSRNLDIIGYMYNDTEQLIRERIAKELEERLGGYDDDATILKCIALVRGKNDTR